MQPPSRTAMLQASASRRALAGFVVSGLLFSFLGAILPAWGYHLRPHFIVVGTYFLTLNAGVLAAVVFARELLRRKGTGATLVTACTTAFAALFTLALTAPPVGEWWRIPGLLMLGFGAGLLNTAIFHAISPAYRLNPAATVNLSGALFGIGSGLSPLLMAGTFGLYSLAIVLLPVALVPAFFAVYYAGTRFSNEPVVGERPAQDVLREFTIPSAILLALLLFFHFGNEFAIAGWLPLFLIQRLGISPAKALLLMSVYCLALTFGRLITQALLRSVSHFWLLLASALAALFGCLVLTSTNNQFGAWLGTLLVGFGFAPIYPLVVEKIGLRFPHYHPGFFNGIFSVGLTGGMLAPATLGYAGEVWGIRVVMALPAIGTAIVVVLVLVIWAEAKLRQLSSPKEQADGLS